MKIYVLVIISQVFSNNLFVTNSTVTSVARFNTRKACEEVKNYIEKNTKNIKEVTCLEIDD